MTRRSRSRDKDPVELIKVKGPNGEDALRVASEEEIIAGLQAEKDEKEKKEKTVDKATDTDKATDKANDKAANAKVASPNAAANAATNADKVDAAAAAKVAESPTAPTEVIINYLKDLYKKDQKIQEDPVKPDNREKYIDALLDASLNNCHFKCNQQDPPGGDFVINEKYKRVEFKLPGSDINKCTDVSNQVKTPTTDPKQYFKTLNTEGAKYFIESHKKYFFNEYKKEDWKAIKDDIKKSKTNSVDNTNSAIGIFGPAELLLPFSNSDDFLVLSHMDWTPNINFNYVVDMLCKKKEIFFVLPTGETNNAIQDISMGRVSLASNCKNAGRATLSELFEIKDLEKNNIVEVKQVNAEYDLSNGVLNPAPYKVVIFHVKVKNEAALCSDPLITSPIDYSTTISVPAPLTGTAAAQVVGPAPSGAALQTTLQTGLQTAAQAPVTVAQTGVPLQAPVTAVQTVPAVQGGKSKRRRKLTLRKLTRRKLTRRKLTRRIKKHIKKYTKKYKNKSNKKSKTKKGKKNKKHRYTR